MTKKNDKRKIMKVQTGSFNHFVTAIKFSGRQKGC